MIAFVLAQASTSEGLAHKSLWYPTVLGILIVVAAVALFCGSVYLLLTTNLGARLGFLIAAAGLTGMMCLLSLLWLTTASPLDTLKGRQPTWKAIAQVGKLNASAIPAVRTIKTEGDMQKQTLEGTIITPDGRETKVEGRVTGDHVRFTGGLDVYTGRVRGKQMFGEVSGASGGRWTATRMK